MGVDARGFPGGLLRLDPTFSYIEPPSSWPLPWAECLMLAPNMCVCVSSLYSSDSNITKCWIDPNTCECLSQHFHILTPTPGNPFVNIHPLVCLGFDTLHWDTSMCRYSPCSTQLLITLIGLAHLHAWMPSSPCLASDFLHKTASSLWIWSSLELGYCSAWQASLLFNILWTKPTSHSKLLLSVNAS